MEWKLLQMTLVFGCGDTEEECQRDHNANLQLLLQRARDQNRKLNKKKLKLCPPKVSYMGHRLTKDGLSPDPAKVKAISDMPHPGGGTLFRLLTVLITFPATTSRSSSSTEAANRAVSHVHMANPTRGSIPVLEDYDHQSSSPKIL